MLTPRLTKKEKTGKRKNKVSISMKTEISLEGNSLKILLLNCGSGNSKVLVKQNKTLKSRVLCSDCFANIFNLHI